MGARATKRRWQGHYQGLMGVWGEKRSGLQGSQERDVLTWRGDWVSLKVSFCNG